MKLPGGVAHLPGRPGLVVKGSALGLISIQTDPPFEANDGYVVNDRTFGAAIAPFLRGDWEDFDRLFGLDTPAVVYSGAEHRGQPKLPNITVVPNLRTTNAEGLTGPLVALGCTMGHTHEPLDDPGVVEMYELQSCGMLAIDRGAGEVELWVGQDGDKVAVPAGSSLTLYNLGDADEPLITLDFANPDRHRASKDAAAELGPVLLGYYDDDAVTFVLNRLHVDSGWPGIGVQVPGFTPEVDRTVRISRRGRLALGALLVDRLTTDTAVIGRFARLGFRIRRARRELAVVNPTSRTSLWVARPLVDAGVWRTGPAGATGASELYRVFYPASPPLAPARPEGRQAKAAARVVRERSARILDAVGLAAQPDLHVLIEGAGAWVRDSYRPAAQALGVRLFAEGHDRRVTVYYCDDTRWTYGAEPDWVTGPEMDGPGLREVYLDKSIPNRELIYRTLASRVAAVLIVTPDVTHGDLATQWVRWGTPLVIVEKPFDVSADSVGRLFVATAEERRTWVLGVDHFHLRAWRLVAMIDTVMDHLGGGLSRVDYVLAERRPIELGRVRTLQAGLTVDLLPHLLALLTTFGDLGTVDDLTVGWAGQYEPLIAADPAGRQIDLQGRFANETASLVQFSFEDFSGSGYRVPVTAVCGKGFERDAKFADLVGVNGNVVRIDFRPPPPDGSDPGYPWESITLVASAGSPPPPGTVIVGARDVHRGRDLPLLALASGPVGPAPVPDPYDPSRLIEPPSPTATPGAPTPLRWPLDRERYQQLFADLADGTASAVGTLLLPAEARAVVLVLDRIAEALLAAPRQAYPLWGEHPIDRLPS